MNNYKFHNTTQEDQLLPYTATVNKHSENQFDDMTSKLRPLQLKLIILLNTILQIIQHNLDYF